MENQEMRRFVLNTLMEAAFKLKEADEPVKPDESVNTSEDLVKNEDSGENTLNEKTVVDDNHLQGTDKIFAKLDDKLKY